MTDHAQCQLPAVLHCMAGEGWLFLRLVVSFGLGEQAQVALVVAVSIRHTIDRAQTLGKAEPCVGKEERYCIPAHVQSVQPSNRGWRGQGKAG